MIKLLALDVDGTITEEDQTIGTETIEMLRNIKMKDPSLLMALVSGNALPILVGIRNTIGVGDILFAENGGIMFSYLDMPVEKVKYIGKYKALTIDRGNMRNLSWTLKFFQRDIPEIELNRIKEKFEIEEFFTNKWRDTSLSINARPHDIEAILDFVKDAKIQNSGYALHIMNKGQDKGFAIRKIIEYTGVRKDQILACGDGGNDIDMFKNAEFSGTPKNGSKEAKLNCNYISSYSYGRGLKDILNHYGLI